MSLTNPKDVITEERLAEFYQQILPYLGGMPEVLANKFSKSDLYSTDEKIVGQWTDGKPLYQKTIFLTSSDIPNAELKAITHDTPTNVSTIINILGYLCTKDKTGWTPIPRIQDNSTVQNIAIDFNVSNNTIYLKGRGNFDFTTVYDSGHITLQYTKTTDTAVSMGDANDYSTSERIVGTWIDGKPLYQKTIEATMPTITSDLQRAYKYVTFPELSSIDKIVYSNGICIYGGVVAQIPQYWDVDNNNYSLRYNVDLTRGLYLFINRLTASNAPVYITIQYTKTTD